MLRDAEAHSPTVREAALRQVRPHPSFGDVIRAVDTSSRRGNPALPALES
ncbi:hypothetical protein ABZT51_24545 [Streptomyces sp. NPDC005373]